MKILFLLFSCSLQFIAANSQRLTIPMDSSHWNLTNKNISFETHNGIPSLRLTRKIAWANLPPVENGILEVDISMKPDKAFAGLVFRGDDNNTCENVYLRGQKSGNPDAVQYTPEFHNEICWKLYPEYQANFDFSGKAWEHLKIIFNGSEAKIFLDTIADPVLVIPHLRSNQKMGKIGVWSLFEAYFSNFTFTPINTPASVFATKQQQTGILYQYNVSSAFVISRESPLINYPGNDSLNMLKWEKISTDEDGLLNISQYRIKAIDNNFRSNSHDAVWLKIDVPATKAMIKEFRFDFADQAWIFLNGKMIFYSDHSLGLKSPVYMGEIDKHFLSDALYLPVQKGNNELLIALSSIANGWGFISRLTDKK